MNANPGWWQQWLQQPQRTALHGWLLQVHFWIGTISAAQLGLTQRAGILVPHRNIHMLPAGHFRETFEPLAVGA